MSRGKYKRISDRSPSSSPMLSRIIEHATCDWTVRKFHILKQSQISRLVSYIHTMLGNLKSHFGHEAYKLKIEDLEIKRNMNSTEHERRDSQFYLQLKPKSSQSSAQLMHGIAQRKFVREWNLSQLVFHSWSGWNIFVFNQMNYISEIEIFLCFINSKLCWHRLTSMLFVALKSPSLSVSLRLEWNWSCCIAASSDYWKTSIDSPCAHSHHHRPRQKMKRSIY